MSTSEVDPLDWVRSNPQLFFPRAQVDAIRLLAYVMSDILELGLGECRISRRAEWWVAKSDVNWLAHELSVHDLFRRVVPAPQHGEHSMRAEVIVMAYAKHVFVSCKGRELVIKGDAPIPRVKSTFDETNWSSSLVAFRF